VRLLIIAPGHPAQAAGGAETAAYALYEHLKVHPDIASVVFAACSPQSGGKGSTLISHYRDQRDEYLFDAPDVDALSFSTSNRERLSQIIDSLISISQPDIVHIHHFHNIGIEIFEIFENKKIKIVFTTHEMLPICHRHGQMLKSNNSLCKNESPADCNLCFPSIDKINFYHRKNIISDYFQSIDFIVFPSFFIESVFNKWGSVHIIRQKVIENPLALSFLSEAKKIKSRSDEKKSVKINIGFFGRITPYKGLMSFLKAADNLTKNTKSRIYIGIHGTFSQQSGEFIVEFNDCMEKMRDCVSFAGPYGYGDTFTLMQQYDWIVVPSVWWENSPVVIQEALASGTPVLTSRIGGMAEKVEEGLTGHMFVPGSIVDIRRVLENIASSNSPVKNIDPEMTINRAFQAVEDIVSVYKYVF
jgi:glycosyltransferase involved in cell wall biosynthesis